MSSPEFHCHPAFKPKPKLASYPHLVFPLELLPHEPEGLVSARVRVDIVHDVQVHVVEVDVGLWVCAGVSEWGQE